MRDGVGEEGERGVVRNYREAERRREKGVGEGLVRDPERDRDRE